MQKFSFKRLTAWLLTFVMLVSIVPANVSAATWEDFINSFFTFPQFQSSTEPSATAGNTAGTYGLTRAAGETTYVLAGSDFQADSGDAAGTANINNIITAIKGAGYTHMDGFLFAGDYSVGATKKSNVTALKNAILNAGLGLTESDMVLIQGNHDNSAVYRGTESGLVGSVLNKSGADDAEAYGVFVINEEDYGWHGGSLSKVEQIAGTLETYLNVKRNAGYTKPIFVVSHLPLNYSMRTKEGDAMYANLIFNVLNKAGAAGLNIIFMFGHDHSNGWDDYLGGSSIYLAKGDKINIAQSSKTSFKEETLAFTYMNAGYVGYYQNVNTGSETALTMTVFEITDDEVTVNRYSATELHDLKSKGVTNSYKSESGYSPDTTVYKSPQTITLNKTITPVGEEIEAPESGTTANQRTYTRVTSTSDLVSGGQYLIIENASTDYFMLPESITSGDRTGFDIETTTVAGADTITGDFASKEWTMTSSGSGWILTSDSGDAYMQYQSTSRARGIFSTTNRSVFTIGGSANAFTFATTTNNRQYVFDHSSEDLINGYVKTPSTTFYIYRMTNEGSSGGSIDTEGGDWVVITKPQDGTPGTPASTKYVYTLDTDGTVTDKVDAAQGYLIVGSGNDYAMTDSLGRTSVTITNNTITLDAQPDYEWWITADGKITDGTNYLKFTGSNNWGSPSGSVSVVTNASQATAWEISHSRNGQYTISYDYSYSSWGSTRTATYYLRYNSNAFSVTSSSNTVRLFSGAEVTTPATEGTPGTPGLYGKIEGEPIYNVENGTSREDAVAAVQNGIAVKYATAADYSDAKTLTDEEEKSLITWTLDPSYDGVTPGEYAVTIKYGEAVLGVVKVKVPTVAVKGYTVEPSEGTVNKGASQAANTGALIYVQLENGTYYTVPVTVAMLTKADGSAVSTGETGDFENLTLTYNGVQITKNFTLHVVGKTGNNYPEYPNEGAVKVSKTAIYTDEDFRKTGVAQVELSVSGVPSKKGADVIVMLDLSSSMTNTVGGKTRLSVLEGSLEAMMTQLKEKGSDGQPMDIRIAVADFNRYYPDSSSPYYINSADHLKNGSIRTNHDGTNKVYTGSAKLDADAFVSVHNLAVNEFDGMSTKSGTNYDYAFDAIYQLGEAITAKNATDGVERDLFVIFMSDGAPFQFNYFSSHSDDTGAAEWNNWLTGTLDTSDIDNGANASYYNKDGKHWMAEAIKGDPSSTYPVIRKNNAADTDGDTWVNVNGLGAKMYSIGFCLAVDKKITVDTMNTVIRNLASNEQYYYRADNADALNNAFTQIGHDIAYAANNARFVDQMGDVFDLQLSSSVTRKVDGQDVSLNFTPTITVKTYDIWTRQDYLNGDCTSDKIGVRKGTVTVLENVTFSADGKEAYSDQINNSGTNILADGTQTGYYKNVIYAKTFVYNNNKDGTHAYLDTDGDGVEDYALAPETFYWKVGTVKTQELAISYYVYLTDTMEGERQSGSYATNNFAILYYDNYLGNACEIHTVSPMLAWKEANVSYAFYLVDSNGNVIVNRETGQTGTFANKIAATRPVVYDTCKLNTATKLTAIEIAKTDGILPEGYKIFDEAASYSVVVLSDQTDKVIGWEINKASVATTYVTGYSTTDPYSNAQSMHETGYDYTHTTVWFAVVWTPSTIPDQVVIDYGLPVDISVLENDLFGTGAKLYGIAGFNNKPTMADGTNHTTSHITKFGSALPYINDEGADQTNSLLYGRASVNGTKVRYTPTSMTMDKYDKFVYEVQYVINNETQYYYGDVTVIPATTIYYEESFVTFENGYEVSVSGSGTPSPSSTTVADGSKYGAWSVVGDEIKDATQSEDRPGKESLGTIDSDNIYGYDGVNSSITEYSLGTAMQVTVNNSAKAADGSYTTTGYNGYAPTATFTFTGTGFDIISLTDSDSGMIKVTVTDQAGNSVYNKMITNYYGMNYEVLKNEDGTEKKDENGKPVYGFVSAEKAEGQDTIWQVPVIKKSGLTYGTYTVTIQVVYMTFFDQDEGGTGNGDYYFVLDAIRIYDSANGGAADSDTVIEDAYVADGESNPRYLMIKDAILAAADAETLYSNGTTGNGVVFIDGISETNKVSDYSNPGPNNEAYLASGQSISFKLTSNATPLAVHIGVKLAYGSSVDVQFTYTSSTGKSESKIRTFATTTDMYYPITDYLGLVRENQESTSAVSWTSGTITLTNVSTSEAIVSLTNIKATFKLDTATNSGTNIKTASTGYSLFSVDAPVETFTVDAVSDTAAVQTEEPVSIAFLVDAETVADACAVMTAINSQQKPEIPEVPVAPAAFVPEVLEYTVMPMFWSLNTVNVITSTDVASLTVNGVAAQRLSGMSLIGSMINTLLKVEEKYGTSRSMNDYYFWTAVVENADSYEIVAYNADGLASNASNTDSNTSISKDDIFGFIQRSGIFGIMEEIAKQIFTPEKFESYINKRFDGVREIITQTSEDVEYIVVNGEIVDRYITETVVDLGNNGAETVKRVWIAYTDDETEDEDVTVNAYNKHGKGSESKKAQRKGGFPNSNKSNNSNNSAANSQNNGNSGNKWDNGNKGNNGNNGNKGNNGNNGNKGNNGNNNRFRK